jgi:hypothetical protein
LTILWVLRGEFWCSFQRCWCRHGRIASTWKLVPQPDALMLLHCCCLLYTKMQSCSNLGSYNLPVIDWFTIAAGI